MYVLGLYSEDSGTDEEEKMDVDADETKGELAQALILADALGKTSKSKNLVTDLEDVADGLKELDMDHYDEEDDGILLALFLIIFLYLSFVYLILIRVATENSELFSKNGSCMS